MAALRHTHTCHTFSPPPQDGVMVEWEEQLPLQQYAVRVPLWMAHKTPHIMDAFIAAGKYVAVFVLLSMAGGGCE